MKKPSLEEVKTHFKDAKKIKTRWNEIHSLKGIKNIRYGSTTLTKNDVYCAIKKYTSIALFDDEKGYAEIISTKTKKMNKHKKFIKDAYDGKLGLEMCSEWKKSIEERYPEFNDDELELNRWIKDDTYPKWMVTYTSDSLYGIDAFGNWFLKKLSINPNNDKKNRYATDKEVETTLINEAKRRGFKEGVMHSVTNNNAIIDTSKDNRFGFDFRSNKLLFNNYSVFQNGKWAQILPSPKQMTKSQIEKELGYEIDIID